MTDFAKALHRQIISMYATKSLIPFNAYFNFYSWYLQIRLPHEALAAAMGGVEHKMNEGLTVADFMAG